MDKYLYHIADKCDKDSIVKYGLLRSKRSGGTAYGIYLCKNPENWTFLYDEPIIIKVNTEKLDNRENKLTTVSESLDEYVYWDDVNPDCLTVSDVKRSKIIVFEGTDRSGKETQSNLLYNKLKNKGYSVKLISFPNYDSPSSYGVKMYLGNELGNLSEINPYQASVLYTYDRLLKYLTDIRKWLKLYDFIILDRYVGSNLMHQGSKYEIDSPEFLNFIEFEQNLEYNALELPKEDLTIFLDMPIQSGKIISNNRKNKIDNSNNQDIHESNDDYMEKCYNTAIVLADKLNWSTIKCLSSNTGVDGMESYHCIKTIDNIHTEICTLINDKFNLSL